MGHAGAPHAQLLAQLLLDGRWRVRAAACTALGAVGEAAVPHLPSLAGCLVDEDPDVQAAACAALNRHVDEGGRRDLASMVVRYLTDGSAGARQGACIVLGNLEEVAEPHLVGVAARLGDASFAVRQAACVALGKHGAAATPHLAVIVACL